MASSSLRQVLGILLVTAALCVAWRIGIGAPWSPPETQRVRVADAIAWASSIWVDGRSQEDYDQAHIPGAVPLNEDGWDSGVELLLHQWEPGMRVIVYCGDSSCQDSEYVADRLRKEYQLREVYVLEGGWEAWQKLYLSQPAGPGGLAAGP